MWSKNKITGKVFRDKKIHFDAGEIVEDCQFYSCVITFGIGVSFINCVFNGCLASKC